MSAVSRARPALRTWLPVASLLTAWFVQSALGTVRYVWAESPAPSPPYTTWETAAHAVQTAIDASVNDDKIVVRDGLYAPPSEILVNKRLRLVSESGPANCILSGGETHRVLRLVHDDITVEGFTIREGNAGAGTGGGIYVGATGCTIRDCVIAECSAQYGGGVIFEHTGANLVERCIVRHNTAVEDGGGLFIKSGATVRNTLAHHNNAKNGGWVFMYYGGLAVNVTATANHAWAGGGVFFFKGGEVRNSIVYGNTATHVPNYHTQAAGSLTYSCATPLPAGVGNTDQEPQFINAGAFDYRLAQGSPCVDSGSDALAQGAEDLDRTARIKGVQVDMGCYERMGAHHGDSPVHYVALDGGNFWPYTNWFTAAFSPADALAAAMTGDTVWVSNGVYHLTATLSVTNAVTLRSLSGAAATELNGGGTHRVLRLVHDDITVEGFTIREGNAGEGTGGGIYVGATGCTIRDCVIADCSAKYGGGVLFEHTGANLVERCIVRHNTATHDGGGLFIKSGTTVRNTLAHHNSANSGGGVFMYYGGLAVNVTATANDAMAGGGVFCFDGGEVRNSIVYGNTAGNWPNYRLYLSGSLTYSCATPLPEGVGNTDQEPQFIDPGAYDYRLAQSSPCVDSGSDALAQGAEDLDRTARIKGVQVDMGCYERMGVHHGDSPVHYVALDGGNLWPYTNWVQAAQHPQIAIDVALPGDTVLVAPGVYYPGAEIILAKSVDFVSQEGPADTVLDGANVHRVLKIEAPAWVSGFTLRHGDKVRFGAGVAVMAAATVSNCVVTVNRARIRNDDTFGGGVYLDVSGAHLVDCVVSDNQSFGGEGFAGYGGGVLLKGESRMTRCRLTGNEAHYGGGAYCWSGGATLADSVFHANTAERAGGGLHVSHDNRFDHLTLVGNSAGQQGGGIFIGGGAIELWNSIVYGNLTGDEGPDVFFDTGSFATYSSCLPTLWAGAGSITSPPRLMNPAAGDFRLRFDSPCIDTGAMLDYPPGATDVAGLPRVLDGDFDFIPWPDMGAHEYHPMLTDTDGDGIPDGWEYWRYLDPLDPDDAHLDPDGDGFTNLQEYIADTNPWDALSYHYIGAFEAGDPCIITIPLSSKARLYTLERAPAPGGPWQVVAGQADRPGTSASMAFTDEAPEPAGFYRVRVRIP